jgi:hypothetical protein
MLQNSDLDPGLDSFLNIPVGSGTVPYRVKRKRILIPAFYFLLSRENLVTKLSLSAHFCAFSSREGEKKLSFLV